MFMVLGSLRPSTAVLTVGCDCATTAATLGGITATGTTLIARAALFFGVEVFVVQVRLFHDKVMKKGKSANITTSLF